MNSRYIEKSNANYFSLHRIYYWRRKRAFVIFLNRLIILPHSSTTLKQQDKRYTTKFSVHLNNTLFSIWFLFFSVISLKRSLEKKERKKKRKNEASLWAVTLELRVSMDLSSKSSIVPCNLHSQTVLLSEL